MMKVLNSSFLEWDTFLWYVVESFENSKHPRATDIWYLKKVQETQWALYFNTYIISSLPLPIDASMMQLRRDLDTWMITLVPHLVDDHH